MTASERMAGLVEMLRLAAGDAATARIMHMHGGQPSPLTMTIAAQANSDLLAAIGELERDRDAQAAEVARATANARLFARAADTEKGNAAGFKAEVARLAGVARDACDVADELAQYGVATACLTFDASGEEFCKLLGGRSATVRAAIPTPDPADDGDCTACGGPSCACVDDATPDPAVFVAAVERIDRMVFDFGLLSTKAAHRSRDASDEADASGTQRPSAATRDAAKESSSAAWDARMAIKAALLALGCVR